MKYVIIFKSQPQHNNDSEQDNYAVLYIYIAKWLTVAMCQLCKEAIWEIRLHATPPDLLLSPDPIVCSRWKNKEGCNNKRTSPLGFPSPCPDALTDCLTADPCAKNWNRSLPSAIHFQQAKKPSLTCSISSLCAIWWQKHQLEIPSSVMQCVQDISETWT